MLGAPLPGAGFAATSPGLLTGLPPPIGVCPGVGKGGSVDSLGDPASGKGRGGGNGSRPKTGGGSGGTKGDGCTGAGDGGWGGGVGVGMGAGVGMGVGGDTTGGGAIGLGGGVSTGTGASTAGGMAAGAGSGATGRGGGAGVAAGGGADTSAGAGATGLAGTVAGSGVVSGAIAPTSISSIGVAAPPPLDRSTAVFSEGSTANSSRICSTTDPEHTRDHSPDGSRCRRCTGTGNGEKLLAGECVMGNAGGLHHLGSAGGRSQNASAESFNRPALSSWSFRTKKREAISHPIITSCNEIDGLSSQMSSSGFGLPRLYTAKLERARDSRLLSASKNLKK